MSHLARWGFVLAVLPLAACNTNVSDPMGATVPQPMPAAVTANAQDQNFLQAAAASDQFEIRSSQLALQRARRPAVRAFAQKMIDDHTMTTQRLSALAATKGAAASGTLDPSQQQLLATLDGTRNNFDQAYLRAQVTGHQNTVSAFQTELSSGYDRDVKAAAEQTLPMVQQHLQEARRLAGG